MTTIFLWLGLLSSAIYIENFISDCIYRKPPYKAQVWVFACATAFWTGLYYYSHK